MRRAAGFTLLELLIGLVLLGFIMALLFGGFRLAIDSWDAVETHAQRSTDDQAALAFVRRVLGSAQPLRLQRLRGQPLAFSGQTDRMVMVAPLSEQIGLRTIALAIDRQTGTTASALRLVLREGPPPYAVGHLLEPLADADDRTLIGDLEGADFAFFGAIKPKEPAVWHAAWESAEQLPALIRIRLVRRDRDPVELVVATTIDAGRTGRGKTAGVQSLGARSR